MRVDEPQIAPPYRVALIFELGLGKTYPWATPFDATWSSRTGTSQNKK